MFGSLKAKGNTQTGTGYSKMNFSLAPTSSLHKKNTLAKGLRHFNTIFFMSDFYVGAYIPTINFQWLNLEVLMGHLTLSSHLWSSGHAANTESSESFHFTVGMALL